MVFVAVGGTGVAVLVKVAVKVEVGGTGVKVFVGGADVLVDVGGTGLFVLVAVGGTGVAVRVKVAVKVDVGGTGVKVFVGGAGVLVRVNDAVNVIVGGTGVFVLVAVDVLVAVEVMVRVAVGVGGWGITCRASTTALVSVLVVPVNWIVITPPLGETLLITLSSAALEPTCEKISRFEATLVPLMATLKIRSPAAKSPEKVSANFKVTW